MREFRRHDLPFIRIPSVCGNSKVEKLALLGLKYQWEDPGSGRWKEYIAQRRRLSRNKEISHLSTGMHIFSI